MSTDVAIKYVLPWSGSGEAVCSVCGDVKNLKNRCINLNLRTNGGQYVCRKCSFARDGVQDKIKVSLRETRATTEHKDKLQKSFVKRKAAMSAKSRELWATPEYRAKQIESHNTASYHTETSARSAAFWSNIDFRSNMQVILSDATRRNNLHNKMTARWADVDFREAQLAKRDAEYLQVISQRSKELWANPAHADKMRELFSSEEYKDKIRTADKHMPVVSNIQQILYSILEDLGVVYYRERSEAISDKECSIGPYSFDCVIPREGKPTLLIECQGDYWHNLDYSRLRDRQKASYISNNFSKQYELKYLWEHEFKNQNRIVDTIKYWLGVNQVLEAFSLDEVQIAGCQAADYRPLLSKYHYLANAGRGGIALGAYLNKQLIAVCVFSPLVRQNIRLNGYQSDECRELSRLCVHPKFQKHNFGSWFVSRCLKKLPSQYKLVISYCDTTFGHTGAIYKACNFKHDGEVKPDYWYVADDGWVMHKKALYEHANSLKLTEAEFADKYHYRKVWGQKKIRFVFER